MSKVNYAKIRNSQKRADTNPEEKVSDPISPLVVQTSQGGSLAYGDRTPYPVTSSKIESAGLSNLFGENVVMDNLDYINSLLGTQLPGSAAPQRRKKSKTKPDNMSIQPRSSDKVISPSSPPKANNDPLNVPLNSPGLDPCPSILSPYEIENSDLPENKDMRPVEGEEKMKWRVGRNMSNMVSRKEAELYEEYFQNDINGGDIGKRSMSVEDVRIPKRDFSKAGKNNGSALTEGEAFGEEIIQIPTDPTPASLMQETGNSRPPRSDFSCKLGQYIDYFQKSEQTQYKVRKASQYFGNSAHQANSRTESQRSAQSKNGELEKMAVQLKKMKAKIDDLQLTNELLSNERKTWKKKEHELIYRVQNAESETEKAQIKAKKYKEKLKYTQELLQREKLDNENNHLALRRVLANNISTVLEHKIHHYMNNDRGELSYKEQQIHSKSEKVGVNKKSSKDKEYRKKTGSNAHTSLTSSDHKGKGMRYEEAENVKKNKWNNTSLKDKMSPLLSQKDQSYSDEDEIPPERFTTLSKSDEVDAEELIGRNRRLRGFSPRQSDFETSSELGEEFQYYFHGTQPETSKKFQQIQYLQNQLSKLMEKDESQSYSGSHYPKGSQKNLDQHSVNKHRSKPQSSYSIKGREGNYSKMTSFSKQNEHNTRMYRKDLDDTLSPNEALNPSFSNSESGWTSGLGK